MRDGILRIRARIAPGVCSACRGPWIASSWSCKAILSESSSLISTNSEETILRTKRAGIDCNAGDRISPVAPTSVVKDVSPSLPVGSAATVVTGDGVNNGVVTCADTSVATPECTAATETSALGGGREPSGGIAPATAWKGSNILAGQLQPSLPRQLSWQ